jgi:hypothetical protein
MAAKAGTLNSDKSRAGAQRRMGERATAATTRLTRSTSSGQALLPHLSISRDNREALCQATVVAAKSLNEKKEENSQRPTSNEKRATATATRLTRSTNSGQAPPPPQHTANCSCIVAAFAVHRLATAGQERLMIDAACAKATAPP